MDWDEFCTSQDGTHREISGEHILVLDETLTDEDLEYAVENAEHRWGSMVLRLGVWLCRKLLCWFPPNNARDQRARGNEL